MQTLFHHDLREYGPAAAEAQARAQATIDGLIAKGRADLPRFLEHLDVEYTTRRDNVLPTAGITFDVDMVNDRPVLRTALGAGGLTVGLHEHAFEQALARGSLHINTQLGRSLRAGPQWQAELLAHMLNESFSHTDKRHKTLVREVGGTARGILSDSFNIIDTRPLLEAFARSAMAAGGVPILTHELQVKTAVKVLFPTVYSPFPGEVIAFGVEFRNSDYGAGALDIRVFVIRLWCTNFATMESELRKVHLGTKLVEGIGLSFKTHQLAQDTYASAIGDVFRDLNENRFAGIIDRVKAANEKELEGRDSVLKLLQKNFSKGQSEEIIEVYSGAKAPVDALPPGNTQYRLAQAISWWGQHHEDGVVRLDAENRAGQLLLPAKAA